MFKIDAYGIRNTCIQMELFTCGDCRQYETVMQMGTEFSNDATLAEVRDYAWKIAAEIMRFSDVKKLMRSTGMDEAEITESVAWQLLHNSDFTF